MVRSENANRMGFTDVDTHEVSELIREIEEGLEEIVDFDDEATINADQIERLQLLQDDLIDITLVAARMLTSSGPSISLDEVLDHFGYTREELKAVTDLT